MTIDEILTCLIILGKDDEELSAVSNYQRELAVLLNLENYPGKFTYLGIRKWIQDNDKAKVTDIEKIREIRNIVLKQRDERNKVYEGFKEDLK
jgi:hypothetical protein